MKVRRLVGTAVVVFTLLIGTLVSAAPATRATLRVALSIDPVTADPRFSANFPGQSILRHVYEPLIYHDRKGNLIPALAQSWKVIDEGRVLEFKLRKGIKFHNG